MAQVDYRAPLSQSSSNMASHLQQSAPVHSPLRQLRQHRGHHQRQQPQQPPVQLNYGHDIRQHALALLRHQDFFDRSPTALDNRQLHQREPNSPTARSDLHRAPVHRRLHRLHSPNTNSQSYSHGSNGNISQRFVGSQAPTFQQWAAIPQDQKEALLAQATPGLLSMTSPTSGLPLNSNGSARPSRSSNRTAEFRCTNKLCSATFRSKAQLTAHQTTHHSLDATEQRERQLQSKLREVEQNHAVLREYNNLLRKLLASSQVKVARVINPFNVYGSRPKRLFRSSKSKALGGSLDDDSADFDENLPIHKRKRSSLSSTTEAPRDNKQTRSTATPVTGRKRTKVDKKI